MFSLTGFSHTTLLSLHHSRSCALETCLHGLSIISRRPQFWPSPPARPIASSAPSHSYFNPLRVAAEPQSQMSTLGYVASIHCSTMRLIWFLHPNQLLLVQIPPLHQILHTISSKPMISMLLEEGLMYIGVGIVTIRQRRFEFGA